MAFTSLNHYLDVEWMEYAYQCTRKDGAVGVDGQTAEEYAVDLQHNLTDLIDRLKTGRYRALPVRRHYIDKPGGEKRGLGIPSFEDKLAQRAIVMLLEPIHEQDFLECSFGFRPGRSAHQALEVLRSGIMERRGYWVVEVDIRKFFDSLPRTTLRDSIARRVTDGVVRRLIDKWLKAGVLESGQIHFPDAGTPQGSVISPILSNVALHHVVDEWFTQAVQPRLRGPSTLVRFCDDFVMLFAHRVDAERVLAVLGKRLGKFGLQLHPDKTRLVDFRPRRGPNDNSESPLPTSFNSGSAMFGEHRGRETRSCSSSRRKTVLRVRSRRSINNAGSCGIGRLKSSANDCARCSTVTTAILASPVTPGAWVSCTIGCGACGMRGYRDDRGRAS